MIIENEIKTKILTYMNYQKEIEQIKVQLDLIELMLTKILEHIGEAKSVTDNEAKEKKCSVPSDEAPYCDGDCKNCEMYV